MTAIVPQRLKRIRLAHGFSLKELVHRMDYLVTEEVLANYEAGISQPRQNTLKRLADALGVTSDTLCEPLATRIAAAATITTPLIGMLVGSWLSSHRSAIAQVSLPMHREAEPSKEMLNWMRTTGHKAGEAARIELRSKGIRPVHWDNGVVEEDE